jgi:hypothetical protein
MEALGPIQGGTLLGLIHGVGWALAVAALGPPEHWP